jgi:hypothetical protein
MNDSISIKVIKREKPDLERFAAALLALALARLSLQAGRRLPAPASLDPRHPLRRPHPAATRWRQAARRLAVRLGGGGGVYMGTGPTRPRSQDAGRPPLPLRRLDSEPELEGFHSRHSSSMTSSSPTSSAIPQFTR